MSQRKSYDTKIKYLAREGLLPEKYKQQIHRSLVSKWKQEPIEKYTGYELNENLEALYDVIKLVSENKRLQKAIRAYYRINKTIKDVIGKKREYIQKLKTYKYQVVRTVQEAESILPRNKILRLFNLSQSTYRTWAMAAKFKCNHSLSKLCGNKYPQQLTIKEVRKIETLLTNPLFSHWPIVSIAHYSIRNSILNIHPNTWYKYARLIRIKRKQHRKFKPRYAPAEKATEPDKKWNADVTRIKTVEGQVLYIYLVIDNYSRYITSWRVSTKLCARTRLETFEETIWQAELKSCILSQPTPVEEKPVFIVDGGSENNNTTITTFIQKYSNYIDKAIALHDIVSSNSMAEAINKTLKYNYLFNYDIQGKEHLESIMDKAVNDYNNIRPHGALNGDTPAEAYFGKEANEKTIKKKLQKALRQRLKWNQQHMCQGCPFGCKR